MEATPGQCSLAQLWQDFQVPFRSAFRENGLHWLGSCVQLDALGAQKPELVSLPLMTFELLRSLATLNLRAQCMRSTHSARLGLPWPSSTMGPWTGLSPLYILGGEEPTIPAI